MYLDDSKPHSAIDQFFMYFSFDKTPLVSRYLIAWTSYKHVKHTGLLGITLFGAVGLTKELYKGCIADEEIARKSFILSKRLWENNEMQDQYKNKLLR